jgi:Protein of unknown function (DUF5672)
MCFSDITVVGVDGGSDGKQLLPSIKHSMAQLPGSQGLLISAGNAQTDIAHRRLPQRFDYEGYSLFVMYSLHTFIDTRFALIVQQDGWVLNGKNWRADWFEYDYIGAPCHIALCGDQFIQQFYWENYPHKPLVVFNGGFSLRSKRLMEAPSRLGLMPNRSGPKLLSNEDIQLCCFMRPTLEQEGMRFPTVDVAKWFAFEFLAPRLHQGIDLRAIFGHHGPPRKLVAEKSVQYDLTPRQIAGITGESRVFELLSKFYGYSIVQPPEIKVHLKKSI